MGTGCSFCWYRWNCWPSLVNSSFLGKEYKWMSHVRRISSSIMKRTIKQWWSTISPVTTKRTTSPHSKSQKHTREHTFVMSGICVAIVTRRTCISKQFFRRYIHHGNYLAKKMEKCSLATRLLTDVWLHWRKEKRIWWIWTEANCLTTTSKRPLITNAWEGI
jgi:hypothetical protein